MSTQQTAWREEPAPFRATTAGALLARAGQAVESLLDAERGRWALWIPVMFGLGIAVYFALPREPSLALSGALAMAGAALRMTFRRPASLLILASVVCCAGFGFLAAKVRTASVAAPVIAKPTYFVTVVGWVEKWERRADKRNRLTLRVHAIEGFDAARLPYRVRVSIPWPEAPAPGAAVKLRAKLFPPPEPVAPGAFDFAMRAYFQRLGGVGFAVSKPEVWKGAPVAPVDLRLRARLEVLRRHIAMRITNVLSREQAAVAQALIVGERGGLSEDVLRTLRRSGLAHILAISGLHMAIMAGSLYWLFRLLLTLTPGLALRHPVKKWAAGVALAGALVYLFISGGAFATQRAFIMAAVIFVAIMLDRPALTLRNVMLAAFIILLVMPESLLDVSFQMSFAATTVLVAFYERWTRALLPRRHAGAIGGVQHIARYLGGIALTTLLASVAVAPFAAYHFHQFTQYGILGNMLAMPVVASVVMPMALVCLLAMPVGLEAWPLHVMGAGIEAVLNVAAWVSALPGAVVPVPAYSGAALGLIVLGALWLSIWQRRWRLLGWLIISVGLALSTVRDAPDILIEREGKAIAVRDENGLLAATPGRGGQYSLTEWLEADGDERPPSDVRRSRLFRCDPHGCIAGVKGLRLSVARDEAALREDCGGADIVITPLPVTEYCTGPKAMITGLDLRTKGAHAIYVRKEADQTRIIVRTAAQERGVRPWTLQRADQTVRTKAEHSRRKEAREARSQ